MKNLMNKTLISTLMVSSIGLVANAAYTSDSRIQKDIDSIYDKYPEIDRHVDVDVKQGYVTLKGEVENDHVRKRAEDLIEDLSGVKDVNNRIAIQFDRLLEDKVQASIFFSPKLDSDTIDVSVDDGVVTFEGHVPSNHAKELATEKAYKAGASDVKNHLDIVSTNH